MSFTEDTLTSPSGAQLRLRVGAPAGAVTGVVQIHHGLAEHGARYARFAQALSARGIAVINHDHRGHGWTTAPDAPDGVFAAKAGADKVMEDALAVEDHARKTWPDRPLIVFGHSMGGVIAMNHAMARGDALAGVAIWNANLALGSRASLMRFVLGLEGLFKARTDPALWLDALTFKAWGKQVKGGTSRYDWLSRISEEVQAYVDDPKCGQPASFSLWQDLIRLTEQGEDEHRLRTVRTDLPIHLAAGGDDPATDKGKAVKTLSARLYNARFTDVTMRFDPIGRHETLNDTGREQAMEDFADWAERVFAQTR
jgi:alpha-beta hydrolase superfamily lysophospholipase